MNETVVELSRLQFAVTAFYHFLFVPLTIGLSLMLAIMETTYVMTGKTIYRDMTKFWGKLFAINFALGVATGLTMEFQFGTNWSYYSHYVGDIFGAPLAIEALLAFFLESTFVGLFFFGWDRLSKGAHLFITYLVALGSNLSAALILIANGWMQHPVGAAFNVETMRMEMTSFWDLIFNPVAQTKFVHTVSAGYVTAAGFVLGISAWYLLKGRDIEFARRSFRIAAAFGFASAMSVIVLGDESGYHAAETQQVKMAAMEGMWETEKAPAGLTLFGIPDEKNQVTHAEIHIPWVLGIIATRSFSTEIPGLNDLKKDIEKRIQFGARAVSVLEALRADRGNPELLSELQSIPEGSSRPLQDDLGHGLLLKKYTEDTLAATPEMVASAVDDAVPRVTPLFWGFRIMVGLGFSFLALYVVSFYYTIRDTFEKKKWLLKWALFFIPLPWIACEMGWLVAEYGRQPWTIEGVLPTRLSTSSLGAGDLMISLAGFVILYTGFLIVEMYLMIKFSRKGPSILGTGKYHFEQNEALAGGRTVLEGRA